ncbi:hypothetical protein HY988_01505 [Candidatus Micrarchaeota archaeon]|nr:hypothetical protein [Candidatus Micrarchaeota archaeon]
MYHIGIVEQVISPDKNGVISSDLSFQAVVRMWDENLLMLGVDKKIGRRVKKGDYVVADYTPISAVSPHRKLLITKILSPDQGNLVWAEFKNEFDRKRSGMPAPQDHQQMRYIR